MLGGGIVDNIDVLRQGVSMDVGNGKATSFWMQRWVNKQTLLEVATSEPPIESLNMKAQEMWEPTHG